MITFFWSIDYYCFEQGLELRWSEVPNGYKCWQSKAMLCPAERTLPSIFQTSKSKIKIPASFKSVKNITKTRKKQKLTEVFPVPVIKINSVITNAI